MNVYLLPSVLAVLTFAGLGSALFGDGPWDVISWVLLIAVFVISGGAIWRSHELQSPVSRARPVVSISINKALGYFKVAKCLVI